MNQTQRGKKKKKKIARKKIIVLTVFSLFYVFFRKEKVFLVQLLCQLFKGLMEYLIYKITDSSFPIIRIRIVMITIKRKRNFYVQLKLI